MRERRSPVRDRAQVKAGPTADIKSDPGSLWERERRAIISNAVVPALSWPLKIAITPTTMGGGACHTGG